MLPTDTLLNIAQGKQAEQGPYTFGIRYDANNAVDGFNSTKSSAQWYKTQTADPNVYNKQWDPRVNYPPVYWKVDLGDQYHTVSITFICQQCGGAGARAGGGVSRCRLEAWLEDLNF